MHKRQGRKAESLRRVQKYLDRHAKVVGVVNDSPVRAQLDAAVLAVRDRSNTQVALSRSMLGEAGAQHALERELREVHVGPMTRFARARLTSDTGFAALTQRLRNLRASRLVAAATSMVAAAQAKKQAFLDAGYPATFLEDMTDAANAVLASKSRWEAQRLRRVVETQAIASAIASGREAVAMLDAVVGRLIRGRDELIAGWREAKRIRGEPGPARARRRKAQPSEKPSKAPKAAPRAVSARTGRPKRRPRGK